MKDNSNTTENIPAQSNDENKNTGEPADRFKRLLASYQDESLEINDETNLDDTKETSNEDIDEEI